MNLPTHKIKLVFAITLALLCLTRVQAQPVNLVLLKQRSTQSPNRQLFAAPRPPSGIGAPGRRSEAGSRGCSDKRLTSSEKQLTALVPIYADYQPSRLILGTTTAEHPTFWFFVPYRSPFTGEFVLRDKDGELVYRTNVTLPETPGVISLSLPATGTPLLISKPYHWYFKIYCKSKIPPSFVDGWIQRNSLNPTLKVQLEKATPRQKVALYAANGVWYEALTAASKLRRTDLNNTDWAALLQDVGLDDIAPEPILECCQSGKS